MDELKNGIECYKVVRINNGNRCSAGDPAFDSEKYQLHYPKDKIVEKVPGSLGIFCFEDRLKAKKFYDSMWDLHLNLFDIIKVRGYGYNPIPYVIPDIHIYEEYEKRTFHFNPLIKIVDYINNASGTMFSSKFPEGTVAFDKVKVLT